jgi:sorbitol/mannitol transport system permease protein
MNKTQKTIEKWLMTVIVFALAILYFFPILYMFISSFKTEAQAVAPALFFKPTLTTLAKVLGDPNLFGYLKNSLIQVSAGTLISLLFGVPAAFVLAFGNFRKKETNERVYVWFITTILLPPVAVIIPLYTWFQKFGLIGSPFGLLIVYVGFHVPIVVWMLHSFFSDMPEALLEAAEIDGCSRLQQLTHIAIPLVRTGIVAAGLLVAVFIWNEFFSRFQPHW